MKNIFYTLLFFTVSSVLSAQNKGLTCLDFAKGEFNNINANESLNSRIIRKGEKQMEITNGVESYKKIQWLNDCNYVLYFDKKEAKTDKFKKFINKSGGINVTVVSIVRDTLFYKTSYHDGQKEVIGQGKMLKISDNTSFK